MLDPLPSATPADTAALPALDELHARTRQAILQALQAPSPLPRQDVLDAIPRERALERYAMQGLDDYAVSLAGQIDEGRALLYKEVIPMLEHEGCVRSMPLGSTVQLELIAQPAAEAARSAEGEPCPEPRPAPADAADGARASPCRAPRRARRPGPDRPVISTPSPEVSREEPVAADAGGSGAVAPPGERTSTCDWEFHPLSCHFPLLGGPAFEQLKQSIEANGVREAAWTFEGKLLDGRNRARACQELKIDLPTRPWEGPGSPLAFVADMNLHRRHLKTSQRALIGARLKKEFEKEADQRMRAGKAINPEADLPRGRARELAAQATKVSARTIDYACKVTNHGAPELLEAVQRNEVSVSAAAVVAELPLGEQERIVARGAQEIQAAASERRRRTKEARRASKKGGGSGQGTRRPALAPGGEGPAPARSVRAKVDDRRTADHVVALLQDVVGRLAPFDAALKQAGPSGQGLRRALRQLPAGDRDRVSQATAAIRSFVDAVEQALATTGPAGP